MKQSGKCEIIIIISQGNIIYEIMEEIFDIYGTYVHPHF